MQSNASLALIQFSHAAPPESLLYRQRAMPTLLGDLQTLGAVVEDQDLLDINPWVHFTYDGEDYLTLTLYAERCVLTSYAGRELLVLPLDQTLRAPLAAKALCTPITHAIQ
ncbi:hypothetical protein [Xylophilus sp.]|uniref:hypothetical protein n=1 Tax=Xylophilus sp. TaxID=2653893 RepID=UPI0013BB99FF|nr:hypothetical protein [Xylophilus sp.]KAF1049300.1 MAG: hypothetical protein GAK38_00756 [Xylophilus sp.]